MPLDEFQTLNPQMNRPVILAAGTPQILLPYDNANRFVRELPRHRGPLTSWTTWTAPKTMKSAEAAQSRRMSEDEFREVNRIPARMLIKAGSTLLVPRRNAMIADVSSTVADNATLMLAPDAPPLRKVSLRAGKRDSVDSIAKRYRVSACAGRAMERRRHRAQVRAGQTIVVYVAEQAAPAKQTARRSGAAARARTSSHVAASGTAEGEARRAKTTVTHEHVVAELIGALRRAARRGDAAQRRSTKACAIVPRSTYSSSLPIGTPRASRVTRMPRAPQRLGRARAPSPRPRR